MRTDTVIPWITIREALRLNRSEMARELGISRAGLYKLELPGRPTRTSTQIALQALLKREKFASRLKDAGVDNPFGDSANPTIIKRWCAVCGLALAGHWRCPGCHNLIGQGHETSGQEDRCHCGERLRTAG